MSGLLPIKLIKRKIYSLESMGNVKEVIYLLVRIQKTRKIIISPG